MTTRILTFCDKNYLEFAFIWADHIKRLDIENYLVVAADVITYDQLTQRGIKTRLVDISKTEYTRITGPYRLGIVHRYLADGVDVLLTDIDTIWEKNIFAEYENHTGADIYASQSFSYLWRKITSFEMFVQFAFGTQVLVNCGFLYLRSTPKVLGFFDEYMKKLVDGKSEQPPFNNLLRDTRWDIAPDSFWVRQYSHRFTLMTRCFRADINGYNRDFDLRLCLVSVLKVQRGYLDNDGYVYHYRFRENAKLKLYGSLSRLLLKEEVNFGRRPGAGLFKYSDPAFWVKRISVVKAHCSQGAVIRAWDFGPVPGMEQAKAAIEAVFKKRIIKLYRCIQSQGGTVAEILSQDEFVNLYACFFEVAREWKKSRRKTISVDTAFAPAALTSLLKVQAAGLLKVAVAGQMSPKELYRLQQVLCQPGKCGSSQEKARTPESSVLP